VLGKWVRIKLFTSTWRVWREFRVTERNYDENLDATVEVKEVEPQVYPSISFESGLHGFRRGDGVYYELVAVIPEGDKEKIINIWREIRQQNLTGVEILERLLNYISEYCKKPFIRFYADPDRVDIEIN